MRVVAIGPGGLHRDPANMCVAGLGDATLPTAIPARGLPTDHTGMVEELGRPPEASDVTQSATSVTAVSRATPLRIFVMSFPPLLPGPLPVSSDWRVSAGRPVALRHQLGVLDRQVRRPRCEYEAAD